MILKTHQPRQIRLQGEEEKRRFLVVTLSQECTEYCLKA